MQPLAVYSDFQSIATLRDQAAGSESERLVAASEQFSAVFTHMMLKSMRQAELGDGIFDSDQSEFYRDMFVQQLAIQLSGRQGLGFSNLLVDYLSQVSGIDVEDVEVPAPSRHAEAALYDRVGSNSGGDAVRSMHDSRVADLLNVSVTGLLAFQRALATTGHNIANVNTDGYSRQRVIFGTQPPQITCIP